MAAASALMLTACTSEDDVVQSSASQKAEAKAVGFDVYTPAATNVTRAGLEGTMTTGRLQRTEADGGGFGVYAYLVEDAITTPGDEANATKYADWFAASPSKVPNFMVNQKLLWNATNQGWYYSPLKYWPNETDNDSQTSPAEMIGSSSTSHTDRLSFFAYAPYLKDVTASGPGITATTNNAGLLGGSGSVVEPTISYQVAKSNPNASVDLLWGVAPAGGLTYTAVNGRTVTVAEGMPLIDMTKPDVNTNMKFLFNHALARIGIKAVAAIDQIGAGGTLDPNTKITIKEITLTGLFGTTGDLNLDNIVANQANWVSLNGIALSSNPSISTLEGVAVADRTLTLDIDHIAEHLRFQTKASLTAQGILSSTDPGYESINDPVEQINRVGVTTVKQDVIAPSAPETTTKLWTTYKEYDNGESFDYSETTPYYTDPACAVENLATATVETPSGDYDGNIYTIDDKGVITCVTPGDVKYPMVNKWYKGHMTLITDANAATYATAQGYVLSGDDTTIDDEETLTPLPVGTAPQKDSKHFVITKPMVKPAIKYTSNADNKPYYKRDANYFMVVPTKNFENSTAINTDALKEKLRTIRVKIEYYITTEDSKLAAGRAQTKNVIEKDVIFPSLENGKSYNLNLVLGLTSVKMEAEVDDWKVINVQGDLPQNTAE